MQSAATTVEEYLAQLPEDRRLALETVRAEILAHLPEGLEEGMQYGHIGYYVPHSRYPDGYHCDPKEPVPFLGLASQKAHMGVYMFCTYVDTELNEWFREEYLKTGKKLDMGAACVRFKKLENLPVELIGRTLDQMTVDKFLDIYEASIPPSKRKKKK